MVAARWDDWVPPSEKINVVPDFGSSCKPLAHLTCEDVHPDGPLRSYTRLYCTCHEGTGADAERRIARMKAAPPVDQDVAIRAEIVDLEQQLGRVPRGDALMAAELVWQIEKHKERLAAVLEIIGQPEAAPARPTKYRPSTKPDKLPRKQRRAGLRPAGTPAASAA